MANFDNYQEQSFVGTPFLKYVNPNDEDFCRKLNRVVNAYGFDGTWKGGSELGTANLFNRHQDPDASIGLFDAASRAFTVETAVTTADERTQIENLCTRYGITYAEA